MGYYIGVLIMRIRDLLLLAACFAAATMYAVKEDINEAEKEQARYCERVVDGVHTNYKGLNCHEK